MPERDDEPTITDDTWLWRRILPSWHYRKADGAWRPQSIAFIDRTPSSRVSVHIAHLTTAERALNGFPDNSLCRIQAGTVRQQGLSVLRDPTTDNPAHAVIVPSPSKSAARRLAEAAEWVVLREPR